MPISGHSRSPSVDQDYSFKPKHPEAYSFTQAGDGRFSVEPSFGQTQFEANPVATVVHGSNRFLYPRKTETRCRDLRSQGIAGIVYGVLMISCNAVYLATYTRQHDFGETPPLISAVNLTKCAGIWAGFFSIVGGSLAIFAWKRAKEINPRSSTAFFAGLAVSQLICLIIMVTAAVLLLPSITMELMSTNFGWPRVGSTVPFWTGILGWLLTLGPMGTSLYGLKHTLTATFDVLSLN